MSRAAKKKKSIRFAYVQNFMSLQREMVIAYGAGVRLNAIGLSLGIIEACAYLSVLSTDGRHMPIDRSTLKSIHSFSQSLSKRLFEPP
jgi:hypothetical protein